MWQIGLVAICLTLSGESRDADREDHHVFGDGSCRPDMLALPARLGGGNLRPEHRDGHPVHSRRRVPALAGSRDDFRAPLTGVRSSRQAKEWRRTRDQCPLRSAATRSTMARTRTSQVYTRASTATSHPSRVTVSDVTGLRVASLT